MPAIDKRPRTASIRDMNQLVRLIEVDARMELDGKKYGAGFIDQMPLKSLRKALAQGRLRMCLVP